MAPRPFLGVVRLARLSADRAGKEGAPLEIDPDIQPPLAQVEVQRRNLPWGLNSQCRLEKFVRVPSIWNLKRAPVDQLPTPFSEEQGKLHMRL